MNAVVGKIGSSNYKNSKDTKKKGQRTLDGGRRRLKLGVKDKRSHMDQEWTEGIYGGKRKLRPLSSNKTRKRIYADQGTGEEITSKGNGEGSNRKAPFSRKRHNKVNDDDVVEAKGRSVSPRSMWASSKLGADSSGSKRSSYKAKNAVRSERVSGVTRVKGIGQKKFVDVGGGETGLLEKRSKSKFELSKGFESGKKKSQAVSLSSPGKSKVRYKKSLAEDLEDLDEKAKKKKRVIRIDPYDISNKRLDDGIADNDIKKQEKIDLEEKAEMSKNAQFRAIQPSPSVLSYVEDNLLGRRRLIELRRAGYNTELSAPLDNIPFSTSSERERIEENIFRNKLTFFAAAKVSSSFPPPDLPEIAFAGRSNVGKSSLLNALTRQWGVVRTSDKPGLTQTINFFNMGPKLNLVDLPGYGFAYAKEEVKDAWEELVKEYVSTRAGLKRVCLLIDTKWGMKPRDHELIDLMERAKTKYQIVLTKTDVVFPIDVARRAMQIEEGLKAHKSAVQPVMMASSKSGAGIRSLRTVLAKIARFAKL